MSIVDFDEPTLSRIFGTLLEWHLAVKSFPPNIKVRLRCATCVPSEHPRAMGMPSYLLSSHLPNKLCPAHCTAQSSTQCRIATPSSSTPRKRDPKY